MRHMPKTDTDAPKRENCRSDSEEPRALKPSKDRDEPTLQQLLKERDDPTSKLPITDSVSAILMSIVPLTESFDPKIANERRDSEEPSRVK